MAPDLKLVKGGEGGAPAPLASFTHDPRIPSLLSKIGAAAAVAAGLAAWLLVTEPSVRIAVAVAGAALLVLAAQQLLASLSRKACRYTLTAQRLELERGLLGKRHESVELWRVRDVVLDQSFLDRMRGAGTVTIFSTDQVAPVLAAGPIANAKQVYEAVRDAAQAARRDGRVMTLQQ